MKSQKHCIEVVMKKIAHKVLCPHTWGTLLLGCMFANPALSIDPEGMGVEKPKVSAFSSQETEIETAKKAAALAKETVFKLQGEALDRRTELSNLKISHILLERDLSALLFMIEHLCLQIPSPKALQGAVETYTRENYNQKPTEKTTKSIERIIKHVAAHLECNKDKALLAVVARDAVTVLQNDPSKTPPISSEEEPDGLEDFEMVDGPAEAAASS